MIATSQGERYRDFYAKGRSLRWAFRFDVHYRVRRMHEVLVQLGLPVANLDVLDVGTPGFRSPIDKGAQLLRPARVA